MQETMGIKGFIDFKIYRFNSKLETFISRILGKFSNKLQLAFINKYGVLKDSWSVTNTITNAGFAVIAGLAGNTGSQTAFTYLAVGTSSTAPAASQTALGGEISTNGLTRAAATVSRVTTTQTNDTLQLAKTFTVTGSSTVEEVGVFNDATTGTMLGRALTTSKSVVNGDTLSITYKIKFA